MDTVFGFILVLGVLVLVHEWGHYIVARLFGVRVDVFSIGFGPRLFGIKRGATDWRLSAIPLGGYVRMAGQDITEIDSGDSKPTGAPDELMSKKRWQRALISFAGPLVNLLFPVFLLTGYFLIKGEPYPKYQDQAVVVLNLPKDSPLPADGVQVGDQITSLNGIANLTWGKLESEYEKGVENRTFEFSYEHDGQSKSDTVSTSGMADPLLIFGPPPNPPIIGMAEKSKPAYQAGLRRDDVIVSMNGQPLSNWQQLVAAIQTSKGSSVPVTVRRKSELLTFNITPVSGKNGRGDNAWVIGISPGQEFSFRKSGPRQSLSTASVYTIKGTEQVLATVARLVTRKLAVKELRSVIGIADEAGHAVQEGTFFVVSLMAALSVNLGILNLLPIPILDGGHILLLSMEGMRRRDFSLAFKERFIQVGLVFLFVLLAYVMYNDIVRMLPLHS